MLVQDLENLIGSLETARENKANRAEFHRVLLEAIGLLDLTDEEIAQEYDASRPTITRWRNGTNAPHAALRPTIYAWLLELATSRLQRLKRVEQQKTDLGYSSSGLSSHGGAGTVAIAAKGHS